MSLFNSVSGFLSPIPKSFEDPHAHEHELPLYHSPPSSPPIPPPIASTVLWSSPLTFRRVPEGLLVIQRKARYLEQQLQELLDAQSEQLFDTGEVDATSARDYAISTGSTTPTLSSLRSQSRDEGSSSPRSGSIKRRPELGAARRGIRTRLKRLAHTKAEEHEYLEEDLRELQGIIDTLEDWNQRRSRLQGRIRHIEGKSHDARSDALHAEAARLAREIRLKEEELASLKRRHRKVLDELADVENSVEAKLSSYKNALSFLDKEIQTFLAKPPNTRHVPTSSTPFSSLPVERRTLEMALEYWQDEQKRLTTVLQEVDRERAALEEGVPFWDDIVQKVTSYVSTVREQSGGRVRDPQSLIAELESTITYLEDKLEYASSRNWNPLVCAIQAELETLKQAKPILQEKLGIPSKKGKEKMVQVSDTEGSAAEDNVEGLFQSRRRSHTPQAGNGLTSEQRYFDDDGDPDPNLLISHDTDTD
ncbi:uncharacterized protein EI97DRAFT_434606 [Westerdykella ornata]|uniref:Autophagy-related protein 28 n=1 Tax=Westerdykella ornata TaxID=318751 RepID=A0A6A6JEJ3_WESOR|nr:uncharacterized protein EI97DRAFT_434606 [Westerdykella ornata]KAF2275040.1 hypothetical protein EI97DRAFT_434606 [Westerdykella ornata]